MTPIIRSQNPPYQGSLFGMNCHDVPYFDRFSQIFVDLVRCSTVSEVARYLEALSEIMIRGKDLRLVNRLNAS